MDNDANKTFLTGSPDSLQSGDSQAFVSGVVTEVPLREEIRSVEGMAQATTEMDAEKTIALKAKAYEPLCKRIVGVLNSAGVRAVEKVGKTEGWKEDDLEPVLERCEMSSETQGLMATAGARIAARKITDPVQMDYACIAGCLLEWGAGLKMAIAELKRK